MVQITQQQLDGFAQPKMKLAAMPDAALAYWMRNRDTLRRYGLLATLLLFGGGLCWSMASLGSIWSHVRIAPILLLIVIGAPIGIALNSIELCAITRIAGAQMAWRTSLEITILTSAANMLPLPGAALARIAALKAHGVAIRRGSLMLIMSYAIWGGLAFVYSSGALFLLGENVLAMWFALAAAVLLSICVVGLARYGAWKMVAIVALTRLVSLPLQTLRYMLAIAAIGGGAGFIQASVFVVASFIGSAVMLAPSGLGVGEGVVALVSPAASVQPAVGFIAAAIGRAVWMAGLTVMAAYVLTRVRRRERMRGELPCSA